MNTIDDDPNIGSINFGHAFGNYIAEHILHVKTMAVVGATDISDADLIPAVAALRGEELVTWIIASKVERDQALQAAHGAIVGFGADEIFMGIDARMMIKGSQEELEAVKQGDLQRMAEEEGSDVFGLTVECLMVHRFKDGWGQFAMFPYLTRVSDDGKPHIEWLNDRFEVMESTAEARLMGVIPETVQNCFDKAKDMPKLSDVGVDVLGMSEVESQMHVDCAIMKLLLDQGFHVMYNADTEDKRKILMQSTETGVLAGLSAEFAFGGAVDDEGGFTPQDES